MVARIGLVGYGFGGRSFHAPYIQASPEAKLVGIVTRSADRADLAREDCPGVTVVPTLAELVALGVDAVVISTPPQTRRELVLEAAALGVSVVADKPFAPTAAGGQELVDAAAAAGVTLNVFHNRRRDADIVTAKAVLASRELGVVKRLDLRLDFNDPGTLEGGPEGGLLRDLGSHVVDQALWLMGPVTRVTAQLDWTERSEGSTNTGFVLMLEHAEGTHSQVSASKINYLSSKEIRLHGDRGSYVSNYTDVQTRQILSGQDPRNSATWGFEEPQRWGVITTEAGSVAVPSRQGNYADFYTEFALALQEGSAGPVPGAHGVVVLAILDAVRVSAAEHRTVDLLDV